ncbi:VWA domain-containing protein (plasmid) [Pseudorhodobacter turbinis]|uniref:VWA domain-containing protein n=1 Tax=Pseudorhodobacter turbinis TaxID=2500533 RepID=A0A4P8ELZ1_9RHOB|nr:vWA domain-containing protein [Pseudorhodobacter turbinis]QCO58097.1 VWA domain-containing protein [Pseudorhodobacter turbinis]
MMKSNRILAIMAVSASVVALPAFSDTIAPETFSADLALNESVTIQKTVVVEATGPKEAVIDVHFLIDTSGSMGAQVNAAKAASSDLFTSLESSFGDVSAGVGVFSELASLTDPRPNANAIIGGGLSTDNATFTANVNQVTLSVPDNGGDFPESGHTAIALAGNNLAWRPGSNRFMFVFTDASAKGDLAGAQASLANNDISLVTLSYGTLGTITASYGDGLFAGATVFASSTSVADIISDVTAGITAGFANYGAVTVGDLGAGLPLGIEVSTVCTGADIGACVGAEALGDYDREVDRTFTFDVTFKRTADGDADFFTNALVDGGIVAREFDSFPSPVPLPAGLPLLMTAFGALAFARRRRAA